MKEKVMRAVFFALSMIVMNQMCWANPEYARREGKACVYCHFQQNGGPRNFLGHYYEKNGYTFSNTIYGKPQYEKRPPHAPDLAFQRPTAEGRIQNKHLEILKSINFRTMLGESYFAAANLLECGSDFVKKLDLAGIAYNKNLEEMLVRSFFGFGRYNVETPSFTSAAGLSLEFGPLIHLKARNAGTSSGDYLKERLDFFRKVSGYEGKEQISPIYAEFTSADPHYTEKPDFSSGKGLSWADDKMDKTIRTETLGMSLFAKSRLVKSYLANIHSKGVGVTPRAGFYGQVLLYEMLNTMLWLRYGLGFDGANFKSFPPDYYHTRELIYVPHELVVEFDGKTKAPASYYVKERLSHLKDLSALLLGLSEFYGATDPHNLALQKVIGTGPDDSKEFPFSYNMRYLARELALVVLKNLELMHFDRRFGAFYSTATFNKPIKRIKSDEMGLAMIALGKAFKYFYDDAEVRNVCGNLLYASSQFVIQNMQAIDGGIANSYDLDRFNGDFLNRSLSDQSMSIMAFLEAFKVTREERFYRAAVRVYEFLVKRFWDEELNTFRTSEEYPVLVVNPQNFGATIGALREMVLATGDLRTFAYLLAYFEGIVKNYSLQLSELEFTGEKVDEVKDSDSDNILQADMADGKFGIAPVFASEVQVEPVR
jgi:hypothetical protein